MGATELSPPLVCVVYTDAITHDQFEPDPNNPGFNIVGGMKDAKHMQSLGRETGVASCPFAWPRIACMLQTICYSAHADTRTALPAAAGVCMRPVIV